MNSNDDEATPTTEPTPAQDLDQPTVAEQKQPEQPAPAVIEAEKPAATPGAGIIVLQWLTYAFWGWLILGLIWLAWVLLADYLLGERVTDVVPYAIAAVAVLLPIAFFTDFAYRKHEPLKKTGGASVVMIIHAVLFALLGIGTLISAVFILLNMVINGGTNTDDQLVGVTVTGFAAVLYAAAFVRTLNPFKSRKPLHIYSIVMTVLSVALLGLVIAGPVASSVAVKNDLRIEESLPGIDQGIRTYIQDNDRLPVGLDEVDFYSSDAKSLIDDGLVTYQVRGTNELTGSNGETYSIEHQYELCSTFKKAGDRNTQSAFNRSGFSNYLYAEVHPEGQHCFKLKEAVIQYNNR